MEMWVGWILLGAVIGYAASRCRGWSPVAGLVGGAALGAFAFLLFAVDGVIPGDKSVVCPKCAERIKAAATVCRYCNSSVAQTSRTPPKAGPSRARAAGRTVAHLAKARAPNR
jgi:hypothetical protein